MTAICFMMGFFVCGILALILYLYHEEKNLPELKKEEEPEKPPDISQNLKKSIRSEIEYKNMMSYIGDEQEDINLSVAREISKRKNNFSRHEKEF